jgi:hypothetical protein
MRARFLAWCVGALIVTAVRPAGAQLAGLADPATGERYNVEIGGYLWFPAPDIVVSSEGLGIPGTDIDFVTDLGITRETIPELRIVLRPARKHRFRINYFPLRYTADTVLQRSIVFNGQLFRAGLPVQGTFDVDIWRFGYEYDFVYRDRGFVGFIVDLDYHDVDVTLASVIGSEFARARAPSPAIGGTGRIYVAPNVSITGELTGLRIPEGIDEDLRGRYVDFNIYGTLNFNDHVGVQGGYRWLDVNYRVEDDAGSIVLKGWFFGGAARF